MFLCTLVAPLAQVYSYTRMRHVAGLTRDRVVSLKQCQIQKFSLNELFHIHMYLPFAGQPSLPALPNFCTISSRDGGHPTQITASTSGWLMPIANALVQIITFTTPFCQLSSASHLNCHLKTSSGHDSCMFWDQSLAVLSPKVPCLSQNWCTQAPWNQRFQCDVGFEPQCWSSTHFLL